MSTNVCTPNIAPATRRRRRIAGRASLVAAGVAWAVAVLFDAWLAGSLAVLGLAFAGVLLTQQARTGT